MNEVMQASLAPERRDRTSDGDENSNSFSSFYHETAPRKKRCIILKNCDDSTDNLAYPRHEPPKGLSCGKSDRFQRLKSRGQDA